MAEGTPEQQAAYLLRCYTAVDGLWFMKVEEALGSFDRALAIDHAVWSVMPKIQARKTKELLGLDGGLADLRRGLAFSLGVEQYGVTFTEDAQGLTAEVSGCPWVRLLRNSNRLHLAEPIAQSICQATFEIWAREFGAGFRFEEMACGQERCRMRFGAGGSQG